MWNGDEVLSCGLLGCLERALGKGTLWHHHSLKQGGGTANVHPSLLSQSKVTTKPPVLGAYSVASCKLLQPRLMSQIQFNKHVPSDPVTGGRVGTQDARDPALRTAQGEPDDRKVRSTVGKHRLPLLFTVTVWFPDLPIYVCGHCPHTLKGHHSFCPPPNNFSPRHHPSCAQCSVRAGKTSGLRPSRVPVC